ncbi:MAG TPA: hypothetical protein V6D47_21585 [Oscillatoriaceae cyanobacterium]
MRRSFLPFVGLFATTLLLAACGVHQAPLPWATGASAFATESAVAHHWAKIELLTDSSPEFPTEHMRPNGRQTDPEIVQAFGTAMPPSRDALLHFAKGWDTGHGTPVLLVHGAMEDATSSWFDPHGHEGLATYLAGKGFRVFAITFAHRHGDNTLQAEQIANAIARIRAVTGAAQVDVVAHSKGCVAARALASGIKAPWMKGYQHDIRRLVLIAGPELGIDYTFRHSSVNFALFPEHDQTLLNAPMSWTRMLVGGVWMDSGADSIDTDHGNYFPGQCQLLARWDKTYPLSETEQDWYTTYYGGQGFVSFSEGIDKAIAQGGHYIDQLRAHPLDSGVQLAVLAGDSATMPNILNETDGPSDGVVFVKSASYTDDMTKGGAKLVEKTIMHLCHMDLIIDPQAHKWVADVLSR